MFKFISTMLIALALVGAVGCGKKGNSSKPKPDRPELTEEEVSNNQALVNAVLANDLLAATDALRKGASPDQFLADSVDTLLTYTVKNDLKTMLELLVESGALLDKANKEGDTPLLAAARNVKTEAAKVLVAHGANKDAKDNNGNTPMMVSIIVKNAALAQYLMENQANIYITNNDNKTALDLAREFGLSDLALLIATRIQLDNGVPSQSTLLTILGNGDINALRALLNSHPEVLQSSETYNPIVMAMKYVDDPLRALEMVNLLLEAGANVDGNPADRRTPLIEAIEIGNIDFVETLLGANADVNKRDASHMSALMYAVQKNNPDMVRSLYGRGAEKKYTVRVSTRKTTFNACAFARRVDVKGKPEAKKANEEIKDELKCGLRGVLDWIGL